MTTALQKVETPLSERYQTRCESCGWLRQFFGTAEEARKSALTMGWEFRTTRRANMRAGDLPIIPETVELAHCPVCKLRN